MNHDKLMLIENGDRYEVCFNYPSNNQKFVFPVKNEEEGYKLMALIKFYCMTDKEKDDLLATFLS